MTSCRRRNQCELQLLKCFCFNISSILSTIMIANGIWAFNVDRFSGRIVSWKYRCEIVITLWRKKWNWKCAHHDLNRTRSILLRLLKLFGLLKLGVALKLHSLTYSSHSLALPILWIYTSFSQVCSSGTIVDTRSEWTPDPPRRVWETASRRIQRALRLDGHSSSTATA